MNSDFYFSQLYKAVFHSSSIIFFISLAMIYASSKLLGVNTNIFIYIAASLIFFSTYLINRLIERKEDDLQYKQQVDFITKYFKILLFVSLIAYSIALIIIGFGKRLDLFLLSLFPLTVVLSYTIKWLPSNFKFRRLKDVFVIKNAWIALGWISIVVFLVNYYNSQNITAGLIIIAIFFFFRIFINTVVFDMRDHKGDEIHRVMSIPVILGIEKTKIILVLLNLFIGLFIAISAYIGLINSLGYFASLSTVYTFFYMFVLERSRDKSLVCNLLVDGEYFVLAFFVFLGTLFI